MLMAMTPTLDPDLLRAFIFIAEEGSFTRAAQRVGRTQSAVSMQVQRLEAQLGQRLLSRGKGGTVQLTATASNAAGKSVPATGVTYASSTPTILTVSPAGLATAVGPVGTATVTASLGAVSAAPATLTVTAGPAARG